jgi:hypothetical protein
MATKEAAEAVLEIRPANFSSSLSRSVYVKATAPAILAALAVCLCWQCLVGAQNASAGISSTPDPNTWVSNAPVFATAHSGTTTYIGGAFTYLAPAAGQGVPIDSATGVPVAGYPKVAGQVRACVPDGSRGWYIGGDFTRVGTYARKGVARVRSDLTVDPSWNPNCDAEVSALAVSGSTVYAGGAFTTVNGSTTRNHIAAFNNTDGTATSWNPNCDNDVNALAVSGSTVFAGGTFTTVNGSTTRNNIAAFNNTNGTATSWNPDCDGTVDALAVNDPDVYIGGSFISISGHCTSYYAHFGPEASSSAFYFAEGTCRPNFDPYICVQNPGNTDATVRVTYMKGDGATDTQDLTVKANSRSTLRVKDKLGESDDTGHDFSAKVECTNNQQIIVERPMYFNYNGVWTGGHDVVGATRD